MELITSQLLEEAIANVNIGIVLGLMGVGFLIKHLKFLEKVENNLIPPILLLLSLAAIISTDGFTVASIISAIINASVAVGLHQNGKNIFTITIVPYISELFKKLAGNVTSIEDEESEEEEIVKEFDEE